MSQIHEETIVCPNCGERISFQAYDTLNRAFDPEAANKLMNGRFFEVRCPHCGTIATPLYSMLYHDPENITLIWYSYDRTELINSVTLLQNLREQVPSVAELAAGYRLRITDDPLTLSEKALIFAHELDDRFIEIYKLRMENAYRKQHPETVINRVLFDADEKRFIFFTSQGRLDFSYDAGVYNEISDEFIDIPDDIEINREWAEQQLNGGDNRP